jgi:hypothetical protein
MFKLPGLYEFPFKITVVKKKSETWFGSVSPQCKVMPPLGPSRFLPRPCSCAVRLLWLGEAQGRPAPHGRVVRLPTVSHTQPAAQLGRPARGNVQGMMEPGFIVLNVSPR